MSKLNKALWVEILKVKKSKIFWITITAFSFITIVIALMMFILKNPELARNTGLLGEKAQIIGEASWPSYFEILSQIIAMGGLVGYGFIASWMFGREFSDQTIEDILSLPTSRATIITAKFIIMFFWSLLLSCLVLVIGLIAGKIVGLSQWSLIIFSEGTKLFIITSLMTIGISTLVAFFASYGRGYLPPMGFVISTIVISQFLAALGHGAYIPWSIPALYSGAAGPTQTNLEPISFVIIIFTTLVGYIITIKWWKTAEFS